MSASLPQVSWDSRPALTRLRRAQLYKVLDNRNIPYPPGAPKTQMLSLLEANNINLNEPVDDIEWRIIEGKDEHGNPHREFYPVTEVHESAREQAGGVAINYDKIIAERAAEAEKQEAVIGDQATLIRALSERLAALEANQLPLEKMTPPQLKSIAKQRNIDVKGLRTKVELVAALENVDGENTS